MSRTNPHSNADLPLPSDLRVPRPIRGDGWNALADIEVFVFAVEAELEAVDRERIGVHRRGRKPDPALRRRLIGLIWTLTFGGVQWRVAGWLSGVPFITLHSAGTRDGLFQAEQGTLFSIGKLAMAESSRQARTACPDTRGRQAIIDDWNQKKA